MVRRGRLGPVGLRAEEGREVVSNACRKDDDGNVFPSPVRSERSDQIPTIHDRHPQVDQHHARQIFRVVQQIERGAAILGLPHVVTSVDQGHPRHGPDIGIIIYDEYFAHRTGDLALVSKGAATRDLSATALGPMSAIPRSEISMPRQAFHLGKWNAMAHEPRMMAAVRNAQAI
jgi:hypothetical protein